METNKKIKNIEKTKKNSQIKDEVGGDEAERNFSDNKKWCDNVYIVENYFIVMKEVSHTIKKSLIEYRKQRIKKTLMRHSANKNGEGAGKNVCARVMLSR